jgi:hypothetical protein
MDHSITSTTIERALHDFENARQQVREHTQAARDRVHQRLGKCAYVRVTRTRRRQEAESARWETEVEEFETELASRRTELFTKADKAGIQIILSPVQSTMRRRQRPPTVRD